MAAFGRVHMNVATGVFVSAMADGFVIAFPSFLEATIGRIFVNAGTTINFFMNCSLQSCGGNIGNYASAQFPLPFDSAEYWRFRGRASGSACATKARLTWANVNFIAFHGACKLWSIVVWCHRKPNPIHQEQCALVANLAVPLYLQCGNALFGSAGTP